MTETKSMSRTVAQWIESNGYVIKLKSGMWYDILSDEIFVQRGKNGDIVKATVNATYTKRQ